MRSGPNILATREAFSIAFGRVHCAKHVRSALTRAPVAPVHGRGAARAFVRFSEKLTGVTVNVYPSGATHHSERRLVKGEVTSERFS